MQEREKEDGGGCLKKKKKKTREGGEALRATFANCHSIHSPERFQKPTHAEIGGRGKGGKKGSHPAKAALRNNKEIHTRAPPPLTRTGVKQKHKHLL